MPRALWDPTGPGGSRWISSHGFVRGAAHASINKVQFPPSPQAINDVERILAIYAHPDDIDFGSAGTVARWVESGIEVTYLIVTSGEASYSAGEPPHLVAEIRRREQRAAAEIIGVKQVSFLDGYADGTVTASIALRLDLTREIRRARPDRILTSSPMRRWENLAGPSHPDHLAVGESATCAVYPDARNPSAFPELLSAGLAPWIVREIWYSASPNPDHFVDVTATYEKKMTALRAHVSQTQGNPLEWVREMLASNARKAGMPDGRLAEGFSIVSTA